MTPDDVQPFPWDLHPNEVVCPGCRVAHHRARPCPSCEEPS